MTEPAQHLRPFDSFNQPRLVFLNKVEVSKNLIPCTNKYTQYLFFIIIIGAVELYSNVNVS